LKHTIKIKQIEKGKPKNHNFRSCHWLISFSRFKLFACIKVVQGFSLRQQGDCIIQICI